MEENNPYSEIIGMETVSFAEMHEKYMEDMANGKVFYKNEYYEPYPGYYAERFNAFRNEVNQAANTVEEKKPYSEMSMEELKDALSGAENKAALEKRILDKTELLTSEYFARKAEYDASMGEVNALTSEIFRRNQEASLSRLNEKSLAALEDYYQFQTEGPGTTKTVLSFIGLYDGYARKMDRDALKENVLNALVEQGISADEFDAIYEYYTFKRDAERASEKKVETEAAYENGNIVKKVSMNVGTVLNSPVRGVMAMPEMLHSFSYIDPYAPLNVNSPAFYLTNRTDTVRAATMKDIDNEVGKDIYQYGMNAADMLAILATTRGTGYSAIPSVANTTTSAAKTSTENGASKEQALRMGIGNGIIDLFSGKIPFDKVPGLQGNDLLTRAVRSGLEQASGTGAATYLDSCINGNNSQFNQRVQAYISKDGVPLDVAQKLALLDVFEDMGISVLNGAMSNVSENYIKKIDLDSPKINIGPDQNSGNANANAEKTGTNTAKQQQNNVEVTR